MLKELWCCISFGKKKLVNHITGKAEKRRTNKEKNKPVRNQNTSQQNFLKKLPKLVRLYTNITFHFVRDNSYFEHMIYNSPGFYYVARCQLFVIEPSDSYQLARRSTSTLSMNVLITQQKHLRDESNQCEI